MSSDPFREFFGVGDEGEDESKWGNYYPYDYDDNEPYDYENYGPPIIRMGDEQEEQAYRWFDGLIASLMPDDTSDTSEILYTYEERDDHERREGVKDALFWMGMLILFAILIGLIVFTINHFGAI